MCFGSESKPRPSDLDMEGNSQEKRDGVACKNCSKLLELSAKDDLAGFISEVEEKGCDLNELSYWYGRRIGSRKMGFEERTPILIASMYGSTKVLKYIVESGKIDVNRAYGSDGVTALHLAAAGGSDSSVEAVKLLLDASADVSSLDANGNKPGDLIAPYVKSLSKSNRKALEMLVKGAVEGGEEQGNSRAQSKEGGEKKEYPIDVPLPDINIGLYGTDDFRMYSFKVKPCSRAYSHDWTECPFVHPGENARRRDPKKYQYSCVPCPDFKKGTCAKGDACEYAHGVFESWLHPAQYRTRLCKDETGCSRKVCFFAHKPEELRPLYASTGSAMPSPKSAALSSMDMATSSPLTLGSSSSKLMPTTSTPPMSPSTACSSPMGTSTWQNKMNATPPALQLPGSRLKTALNARDLELLGLESMRSQQQQRQQHLMDEMAGLASPSHWNNNRIGDLKPTKLDDVYGSLDPSILSQLQSLSPMVSASSSSQLHSPTGIQMRQNMNQLHAPSRKSSALGFDTSAAVAAAVMNSRSAGFAKRSQSFIDRGAGSHRGGVSAFANSPTSMTSNVSSDWGSPNGKLDWGFNSDDLSKLRKSASFGFRNVGRRSIDEPDVSWVNSLVKDVPSSNARLYNSEQKHGGTDDIMSSWIDQLYIIESEQLVA